MCGAKGGGETDKQQEKVKVYVVGSGGFSVNRKESSPSKTDSTDSSSDKNRKNVQNLGIFKQNCSRPWRSQPDDLVLLCKF